MILKHDFRYLKICNICPKDALLKPTKELKSKTSAWFQPETHRLLAHPSTGGASLNVIKCPTNKTY